MNLFEKIFNYVLKENMVSGGTGSVWGGVDAGAYGNQFPSQNDKAYNPNDSRPFDPAAMILGAKIKQKKKGQKKQKKIKFPVQRRPFTAN
jgi:hypothetical protein